MKKYLLIFILLLSVILIYSLFPSKTEPVKTAQPKKKQEQTLAPKIDYTNAKVEKELNLTLPKERVYKKENYEAVAPYKEGQTKQTKESFTITGGVDINREKQSLDGGTVEFTKKF